MCSHNQEKKQKRKYKPHAVHISIAPINIANTINGNQQMYIISSFVTFIVVPFCLDCIFIILYY